MTFGIQFRTRKGVRMEGEDGGNYSILLSVIVNEMSVTC